MATRKIVTIGDDTLRKICRKQEKFDLRLSILLKDMADTMYKAEGVGLAGPQVGILRRIAVVDVTEDHSGLLELVNPEIIEADGCQTGREGCLSVPGRQGVVTRPITNMKPRDLKRGQSAMSWITWTENCILI